jgi:hypothetical protein
VGRQPSNAQARAISVLVRACLADSASACCQARTSEYIDTKSKEALGSMPFSEQFYWFELEVFQRERMKHFIRDILGNIANAPGFNSYKYVFFDCSPNFG